MRILHWAELSAAEKSAALSRPAQQSQVEIMREAEDVIAAVRTAGDAALLSLTERFDGVRVDSLELSRAELAHARNAVSSVQMHALERAIENVQSFHAAQSPTSLALDTMPGVHCERLIRPIGTVGLYVPAGSAPLPSTVVMLAVPARIAGCRTRILCTPPNREGRAASAVVVAATLCGVDRIFKIGGAQAIAALAFGTATVPKVAKIFGPGNAWVTAAKQLVANDPQGAACDLPAGPSEVMVVADESARADFVASDLLAQAEHDVLAQALLVTDSHPLAAAVNLEIMTQTRSLSRASIIEKSLRSCRCIVVRDLDAATQVVDQYAPEHLILQVREPRWLLPRIQNAGSVFLGAWTPEPIGDYCSGTNHVLPTYGHARAYSGLSVLDFVRGMTVQELTPQGLRSLGPTAVELAKLEGLDAHAGAVTRRLEVLTSLPP